ncbi:hypothetical protein BDR22DRAFT_889289 [Usnea florida]
MSVATRSEDENLSSLSDHAKLSCFGFKLEVSVSDLTFKLPNLSTYQPDDRSRHLTETLENPFYDSGSKRLSRQLFFPFLTADLQTRERTAAKAENQYMRAASSVVWSLHQLDIIYNDRQTRLPGIISREIRPVDPDTDTSTPDPESIAFTVALTPIHNILYVHWLEIWSSGATYHHTTPIQNDSPVWPNPRLQAPSEQSSRSEPAEAHRRDLYESCSEEIEKGLGLRANDVRYRIFALLGSWFQAWIWIRCTGMAIAKEKLKKVYHEERINTAVIEGD